MPKHRMEFKLYEPLDLKQDIRWDWYDLWT
jgi:hypothetical protein